MEPSLVGAKGSDQASGSDFEVGYSVGFLLGGPGSGVVSTEGRSLGK